MGQPIYNAALYLRLSKDDGTDNESQSIQNQKDMLTRYCKENGFSIFNEYVDDGFSGVSFDRPSFNRMITDIEAGKKTALSRKTFQGSDVITWKRARSQRYISVKDNTEIRITTQTFKDVVPCVHNIRV